MPGPLSRAQHRFSKNFFLLFERFQYSARAHVFFLHELQQFLIIGLCFTQRVGFVLLYIGIILFALSVLFTIATLPVEFNASKRALETIRNGELLYGEEYTGAKRVLQAAAMTYVAAALTAIMQLLRLIVIANNRRR